MGNGMSGYGKTLHDVESNDPNLTDLDFSNENLSESKLRKLCERIHNNT